MITESNLIELPEQLQELFIQWLPNIKACQSHHLEFYIGTNVFLIDDGYLKDEYYQYNETNEYDDNYYELRDVDSLPYINKVKQIVRREFLKYESELFLELHGDY